MALSVPRASRREDLLEVVAGRVAADYASYFLGGALHRYQETHHLSSAELAQRLGVSTEGLSRLALYPVPASSAELRHAARFAGADATQLALIVTVVTADLVAAAHHN